jgi:hypothetical protein
MTFCCWFELAGTNLIPPEPLQPPTATNPPAHAATIQALDQVMKPPAGILFVLYRAGQRVIDHSRDRRAASVAADAFNDRKA